MKENEIRKLVMNWGIKCISSEFGEAEMSKDISLLGFDSIDIFEFSEHLESSLNIVVDYEWLMEFETLNDLCAKLAKEEPKTNS